MKFDLKYDLKFDLKFGTKFDLKIKLVTKNWALRLIFRLMMSKKAFVILP